MFDIVLNNIIEIGNVRIINDFNHLRLTIDNIYSLVDDERYATFYCKLAKYKFNSILIGGLGFGIAPYYIENNLNVGVIDVVEHNKNIIDANNQLGHLKNTNIIYDNFITYKTDKKYDLILVDLWWLKSENFDEEKTSILLNYENNLTSLGGIYFPITDELFQNPVNVT